MGSPKGAALSRSLQKRPRQGPPEQVKSYPARLRNTRSTHITHCTLTEPLSSHKSLEPLRPGWPHSHRRFHVNDGVRVLDNDTVVVCAHDRLTRTKKGLARTSNGTVTYSAAHLLRLELDARDLAQVLVGDVPGGGHAWTPKRLEHIFRERSGRAGCWATHGLSFMAFLSLFPKTFEIFAEGEFVRLRTGCKGCAALMDTAEEAVVRLARARSGQGEPSQEQREMDEEAKDRGVPKNSSSLSRRGGGACTLRLPDLNTNRFKVAYMRNDDTMGFSAFEDQVPSQDINMERNSTTEFLLATGPSPSMGGRRSSVGAVGFGSRTWPPRHVAA
jgi:hypothetical protein